MCIMEDTWKEKEKIDDIQTELHGTNHTLRRPKNFSLQRRSDAYYFSDNSQKGILKRVPFKYGSYRFNEIETVLEKHNAAKPRNEIWSDVPLNDPGSSKADKNSTVAPSNGSYEGIPEVQKNETVFESPHESAGNKFLSHGLKNLAIIEDNKEYPKTKNNGKEQLKLINQDQKEERFYKLFQGPKKKKYQTNVSIPTYSEKLKECVSDEKNEKLFASNVESSSSKKLDEPKDESLNGEELNLMQMKTPVTEL